MKRALLIAGILMLIPTKAMAAVNGPDDAEREKALSYLSENAVEIPEDVEYWAEYYGEQYDICPEVLEAVCWVESRCTQDAQSPDKSCKGLMQIHVNSHRARMEKCDVQNVFGVRENIKLGADYLAELQDTEDIAVSLAKYNGQSATAINEARKGKYTGYVKKVLTLSEALERAHNK